MVFCKAKTWNGSVSAKSYQDHLDEINQIRHTQRIRHERDAMIIEKMDVLAQQLEGEAKALLLGP